MNDALCAWALHTVGVHVAHYVVAHQLFTRFGDLVIDVVRVRFQLSDLLVRNRQTQFLFAFGKRNPKLAPSAEFKVGRENVFHLLARIPRI